MTNFVQMYKSTDTGAPVLTGQVGSLITLLNKCLVDGYTAVAVTSITRSGSTATATLASSDSTLFTGAYIAMAGATQTEYNGTFQITVVDPTHFTFTVSGTPATPATGSPTYAKAGLGWAKPFAAGTNAQTYRSADGASDRFYLQVVDNGATAGGAREAQVYGAEVMSADQTVTSGRFPTAAQAASGLCCRKSTTADATARAWTLIGDDRTFYFITSTADAAGPNPGFAFGHFISFKAGDAFKTFILGTPVFNVSNTASGWAATTVAGGAATNIWLARSYTQTGTAINVVMSPLVGSSTSTTVLGVSSSGSGVGAVLTYPNPADSGLYVVPVLVTDSSFAALRGRLPGFYAPLHAAPFTLYDESTGINGLSGVTLAAVLLTSNANQGQGLFDKFGPWT
jgi:hypothetical protein